MSPYCSPTFDSDQSILHNSNSTNDKKYSSVYDQESTAAPDFEFGDGNDEIFYKDVVVIGNGPSALALSAFLSGYKPYYDVENPHPNAFLHNKLAAHPDLSIMDQDLESLSQGLEGRTSHGVSLLYDTLVRPGADMGDLNPSCLTWKRESSWHSQNNNNNNNTSSLSYVCVGDGSIGGSWANFPSNLLTLSFGSWLDLPAFSFRDWLISRHRHNVQCSEKDPILSNVDSANGFDGRVPCQAVLHYFKDYAEALNISDNFINNVLITKVRKITNFHDSATPSTSGDYVWEIHGCHTRTKRVLKFKCNRLVLACGSSSPKRLNVANENATNIWHSNAHVEKLILDWKDHRLKSGGFRRQPCYKYFRTTTEHQQHNIQAPVLVVGDGLSAADVVTRLLVAEIPVVHSFRKSLHEARHLFAKFSKILYPEYHAVCQLMTSEKNHHLYTPFPNTEVASFSEWNTCNTKPKCKFIPGTSNKCYKKSSVRLKPRRLSNVSAFDGHCQRQDPASKKDNQQNSALHVEMAFSKAVISIGWKPSLKFFDDDQRISLAANKSNCLDSKHNPISVDPYSKRCLNDPTIYAVGPLIADNFVRFLVGGCMAASAALIKDLQSN